MFREAGCRYVVLYVFIFFIKYVTQRSKQLQVIDCVMILQPHRHGQWKWTVHSVTHLILEKEIVPCFPLLWKVIHFGNVNFYFSSGQLIL